MEEEYALIHRKDILKNPCEYISGKFGTRTQEQNFQIIQNI